MAGLGQAGHSPGRLSVAAYLRDTGSSASYVTLRRPSPRGFRCTAPAYSETAERFEGIAEGGARHRLERQGSTCACFRRLSGQDGATWGTPVAGYAGNSASIILSMLSIMLRRTAGDKR